MINPKFLIGITSLILVANPIQPGTSHFLNNPHPKSLSLRERDFESGSLLPQGAVRLWAGFPRTYKRNKTEGLGMRAVNLRKKSGILPIQPLPVLAQTEKVAFYCGYTQDGNLYPATMVGVSGREREHRTIVVWKSKVTNLTPQQRCETVSRKFQSAWNRNDFNYLIAGTDRKTGKGLICAVRDRNGSCDANKMLFTVVDRQQARDIIQGIYESMQKTGNPTYQTDPNKSIDMQEFIKSMAK